MVNCSLPRIRRLSLISAVHHSFSPRSSSNGLRGKRDEQLLITDRICCVDSSQDPEANKSMDCVHSLFTPFTVLNLLMTSRATSQPVVEGIMTGDCFFGSTTRIVNNPVLAVQRFSRRIQSRLYDVIVTIKRRISEIGVLVEISARRAQPIRLYWNSHFSDHTWCPAVGTKSRIVTSTVATKQKRSHPTQMLFG